MVRLENITKTYKLGSQVVSALQGVSLHVAPREIFGVIGESGAGKSTLIRCVNLLEQPDSGKILLGSTSLTELSSRELRIARSRLGMIFQSFNLLASRTVFDNIALPLEFANISKSEIKKTIEPLLEITGLSARRNHYPPQLSGGQKQRVAIARALAAKPDVLLSDEATSALDPGTTQSILDLLKNIRDNLGLTILLITHDMSVIKSICDRVAILEKGSLVEQNTVGEFFAHPKTEVAKRFITSALPQSLPKPLANLISKNAVAGMHPLLRLWFFGGAATQPVLMQLIKKFGLRFNILQASFEYIHAHPMGVMTLAIAGESSSQVAAITHLKSNGVTVEELGYVPDHIVSFV